MATLQPFHLAIPVQNLAETEAFYVQHFGCKIGRRADHWVDLDFFGHQLVLHKEAGAEAEAAQNNQIQNDVDEHAVPVPHFGVILTMADWQALADRLKAADIPFVIEPYIRFKGRKGEQATMFFHDPSGNPLEFKAFADEAMIFEPFDPPKDD